MGKLRVVINGAGAAGIAIGKLLISMGFSAVSIGNRVGHESVDITYRYAHMFPTEQTQMAKLLDEEFKEGAEE